MNAFQLVKVFIAITLFSKTFADPAVPDSTAKTVQYGRMGRSIALECPLEASELKNVRSVAHVWEGKNDAGKKKTARMQKLMLENLKPDDSGVYYCKVLVKTSPLMKSGHLLKICVVKLVVYDIPSFSVQSDFTVHTDGRCSSQLVRLIEGDAVKAFCNKQELGICPISFSAKCHESTSDNVAVIKIDLVQRIDAGFDIPHCKPQCVHEAILQRMAAVYHLGKANMKANPSYLTGPVTPPLKLDGLSKSFYMHGIASLPTLIWGPYPKTRGGTKIHCFSGFQERGEPFFCYPCEPGSFGKDGRQCRFCPPNRYQSHYGTLKCRKCPRDADMGNMYGAVTLEDCYPKVADVTETVTKKKPLVKRDISTNLTTVAYDKDYLPAENATILYVNFTEEAELPNSVHHNIAKHRRISIVLSCALIVLLLVVGIGLAYFLYRRYREVQYDNNELTNRQRMADLYNTTFAYPCNKRVMSGSMAAEAGSLADESYRHQNKGAGTYFTPCNQHLQGAGLYASTSQDDARVHHSEGSYHYLPDDPPNSSDTDSKEAYLEPNDVQFYDEATRAELLTFDHGDRLYMEELVKETSF